MNKLRCVSQNTEAKTLPADVCIFGRFGWLSPAAVYSVDCRFDSGVKWWIYVSAIVTCLCKNSFLLCWNSCKQCSELLMRCYFWLTVSKHKTHFEHSFLIDKSSCKMVNTLPFWYLQLLCYVTQLQFYDQPERVCGISFFFFFFFCVFSGTTAKYGWPEHSASFVSVRPF